jgi:hypothetical protein
MKKYHTDKSYLEDKVYLARFVEKWTIGEKEKLKKHYRTCHVFPKNKIIWALKKSAWKLGSTLSMSLKPEEVTITLMER